MKKSDHIARLLDPLDSMQCLIMFSGGKDSTFLAHLFSTEYNNRVTAFTCDNGFEDEGIWRDTGEKAGKLGIEHRKGTDYRFIFKHIFHALISERHVFSAYDGRANLICLFCSHLFWLLGLRYASEHAIPFLIHGMDPGQIRLLLGPQAKLDEGNLLNNVLISKMMKRTLTDLIETFKKTHVCQTPEVRTAVDSLFPFPDDVTTVYPFSFIPYDPGNMMKVLQERYCWVPPNNRHVKYYAGSGCRLEVIFKELEKLGYLVDLEATNVRNMKKKYKMNAWDLFMRDLQDLFTKNTVNLQYPVYDELGIKQLLVQECRNRNMKFMA